MIERSSPYPQSDPAFPACGRQRTGVPRKSPVESPILPTESGRLVELLAAAAQTHGLSPALMSELGTRAETIGRRAARSGGIEPAPALSEFSGVLLRATSRVAEGLAGSYPLPAARLLGDLNIAIAGCWTAFTRGYLSQLELEQGRNSTDLRRSLGASISRQEEDRRRLSRDLHDIAGQAVTSAVLRIDMAGARIRSEQADIRACLGEVRQALLDCSAELHELCFDIRPSMLEDLGLVPTIRSYLRRWASQGDVQLHARLPKEDIQVGAVVETALFRIVQESLTNIRRHARASRVWVSLQLRYGHAVLKIRDDGVGFDCTRLGRGTKRRLGLLGMRERAAIIDASFAIDSAPGRGTAVQIDVPLQSEAVDGE